MSGQSTPMRTRRTRPPGFADRSPAPTAETATPAAQASTPAAEAAPVKAAAATKPQQPRRKPRQAPSSELRDPYAGASTRLFNMRLLEPLHAHYTQLARELTDQGFKTNVTEIVTALMDAGPTNTGDARELLRSYRRKREA